MTFRTRRSVLAAVGVSLASAGCISDSDGTGTDDSTTDDSGSTGDWIEQTSNEPDPDLPVYLNNDADEERTVRVWVVRERTGETVFEETRESSSGAEYGMYNLKRADPEGVESFRICGELVDSSEGTATTANETTTNETAKNETAKNETAKNETAKNDTKTTETTPAEDSDTRRCATVETNECYGTAHVTIQDDGSLQVIYSIC